MEFDSDEFFNFFIDDNEEKNNKNIYSSDWISLLCNMNEQQFNEIFRMSKRSFASLKQFLCQQNNVPSQLDLKLKLFLFFVGHVNTYRRLRESFGLSHVTIFKFLAEIIDFLYSVSKKEIKFPNHEEIQELKLGMLQHGNVIGGILCIDGTLINITKPNVEHPFDFYDRKMNFSLNFVCCVDYKLRLRSVTYGYGKNHDSRILRNSQLADRIEGINVENTYVIGDSSFNGYENILTTSNTDLINEQSSFNNELKKQRMIVEHAFELFKNKFKRFDARIKNGHTEKNIKALISTMFIHNFLINNS